MKKKKEQRLELLSLSLNGQTPARHTNQRRAGEGGDKNKKNNRTYLFISILRMGKKQIPGEEPPP